MIKLVASDLDGTIIDKNNKINEENFKAINKINSNGHYNESSEDSNQYCGNSYKNRKMYMEAKMTTKTVRKFRNLLQFQTLNNI